VAERGQKRRGRKRKAKGKPRKQLPIREIFAKWKAGKSSKELAKEYGVNPGTIRNRLREYDKKSYAHIAGDRTSPRSDGQRKELPIPTSELYEQWKNGKSMRALAKKYKVSRQTIERRLKEYNEQEYNEIAKAKIIASIEGRRKEIAAPPNEIVERYSNGESAAELAEQFNVSRPTITRLLERHGNEDYQRIAQERIITGRTKDLQAPISEVMEKWANGETPENLEKLCNISYRQLLEKLKAYDPTRYREVAQRRGLGSIRAKPYGARSLFELRVRRILEKHGIYTKETTLKLGKHRPRPDFPLLDQNTIIEAMGLNFTSYWKHQDRKTRDYIHYKYKAVAVVPNEQLYQRAIKCLSKKVKIVKYEDFDEFVATSLKKAPNKKRFLLTEKDRSEDRFA
jgi:uncharacterized protein (DUF433 family)